MRRPLLLSMVLWCGLVGVASAQTQKINGSLNVIGSINFCVDTGVVNAYACAWANAPASYRTGTLYSFQAKTTNTASASFNVNGLGPKTIKKLVGSITTDLDPGDIKVDQMVDLKYDGTNLQMISQVGTATKTIASGTIALATAAIASGTCATAQTATATGTATTDVILSSFNGDVSGITGYTPATTGTLRVDVYPATNTVTVKVCNATAASVTPGAASLNWRVIR